MTCAFTLVVTVFMQTRVMPLTVTGRLVKLSGQSYTVDFSAEAPWLGTIDVPYKLCEKAD